MKDTPSKFKKRFILLCCLILIGTASWVLIHKLEGEPPRVSLEIPSAFIGKSWKASGTLSDAKSGLKKVHIALSQGAKEQVLFEKTYPCGLIKGRVHDDRFAIEVSPKSLGFDDGQAVLRIAVWDCSWRKKSNYYEEKDVVIDTRPPEIGILSKAHNISQGGSNLVIFRLSEPCPKAGVLVDDHFYPGISGYFDDKSIYMAFFALSYDQGRGTHLVLEARDQAGNSTRSGFYHYIRSKRFRQDVINISDRFLNAKMPEFNMTPLPDAPNELVGQFLAVNRDMRKANAQKLAEICAHSDPDIYWEGVFLRLPNAARKASFADLREYRYKGQKIDEQRHLGIDLASIAMSPVPAANGGKVVFDDHLGIYGNAVVIDHGFGLFSMYAHLSGIDVEQGQMVKKGDIIGHTGNTGLAGGDHLHFSTMIRGTMVNPVEWWDQSWIENNILSKIHELQRSTAQ